MSRRWLSEHFKDPYVKRAREDGYVCRAAYKLIEIVERDGILSKGMTVVDLGAAPGGWSQVALPLVGKQGRVIGIDLLPLQGVSGIDFIQGDFTESSCLASLEEALKKKKADVVLSDMAPNLSGNKSIDQPRSMYLVELAVDFALRWLKPGGNFVVKVFQGQGVEEVVKGLRPYFRVIKHRKPKASRPRSAELYLVGIDFTGAADYD